MPDQFKSGDDVTALMNAPAAAAPEAPNGHDFTILGVKVHIPAEEKPRLDSNMAGWGTEGAGISPEDALGATAAVRGIAKATAAGGALSGVKSAILQADPIVKYQFVYHGLRGAGVPDAFAIPAAMLVSNYKRGGKAPSTEPPVSVPGYPRAGTTPPPAPVTSEPAPHLDTSVPVRPGGLTSQQIGERIAAMNGKPRPPTPEPVYAPRPAPSEVPPMAAKPVAEPVPAAPAVSPAKIANDLGIAARRAGVKLTAADDAAVLTAISKGADPSQAIADVIASKAVASMPAEDAAAELMKRWGTPSDAERTFPPNKSGLPTKPPKRDMMAKIQAAREKAK